MFICWLSRSFGNGNEFCLVGREWEVPFMFFFWDLFYDLIVSIKVLVVPRFLKGFLFLEEICLGYFLFVLS